METELDRWKLRFVVGVPLLAVLSACCGLPGPVYLVATFYVVCGWALFLMRVLPRVTVDASAVALGLAALLALTAGLHWFATWLHDEVAARRAEPPSDTDEGLRPVAPWRLRTTLAIVGLVLLMFVAGTAAVGALHQAVWIRTRT